MKTYLKSLECPRCGAQYDPSDLHNLCHCGAPLLVRYNLQDMAREFDPGQWACRPKGVWRYRELLPLVDEGNIVSLGEGGTPVFSLHEMGKAYGLSTLLLKDEGMNPTGTFKARGAAVGVSKAKELGVTGLAMPTAGNAGAAWSAYTARAGMKMVVVMPQDAPGTNQAECVAYGADTYLVRGLISDAGRIVKEAVQKYGWFEAATLKEPYRIEGKKTMGLEIWEEFGDNLPAAIIYPTGGGVGLIGMWKAFLELKEMKLSARTFAEDGLGSGRRVFSYRPGVQRGKKDKAEMFLGAHTLAAGIRVPSALGDFLVLDAVRASGGTAVAVSDREILETWKAVARKDGALICPEGAAAVRAAKIIKDMGLVGSHDPILILNTGAGMKYTELLTETAIQLEDAI